MYKNRHLTEKMIKELYSIISQSPYNLSIQKLWNSYYVRDNEKINKPIEFKLMDIISLIRYELGQIDELCPFDVSVRQKFKDWIFMRNSKQKQNFTAEQVEWLQMIRDHICVSSSIETDDLELPPFEAKGGLGKFYSLFGNQYLSIINEMNVALVA